MRRLAWIALIAASSATGLASANAMPLPGLDATSTLATDGGVILASGGCGPGGHRTPYGQCVPNFYRPAYRACPPGYHLGRFRARCLPNY